MAEMKAFSRWLPEIVGTFGFMFFGFWAHSGGIPIGLALLVAVLSGASILIASQTVRNMMQQGRKGRVGTAAIIAAAAIPLFAGFLMKTQGLGHELATWGTIFFCCGTTVGLAMGAYGTYHQMK